MYTYVYRNWRAKTELKMRSMMTVVLLNGLKSVILHVLPLAPLIVYPHFARDPINPKHHNKGSNNVEVKKRRIMRALPYQKKISSVGWSTI